MYYSTINLIKFWLNIFNILLGIILAIAVIYWIFVFQPQKKLHKEQLRQPVEILVPENNLSFPDDNLLGSDNYV